MKLVVELQESFFGGDNATFTVEAKSKEAVLKEFKKLNIYRGDKFYGYEVTDTEFRYLVGGKFATKSVIEVYEVDEWVAAKLRTK